MKKSFVLAIALIYTNLYALECNEAAFNKGNEELKAIYVLYNKTGATPEEQKEMATSKISKKDYKHQMKILEDRLVTLNKKTSDILLANMINNENINTWQGLEQSCHGRQLPSIQQAYKDAIKMKMAIKQRIATLDKYTSQTKMVIKIGKKKYSK